MRYGLLSPETETDDTVMRVIAPFAYKSDPATRAFFRTYNPKPRGKSFVTTEIPHQPTKLLELEGYEAEHLHLMLQVTQNYQLVKVLVTGDVVVNPLDGGQSYQSD